MSDILGKLYNAFLLRDLMGYVVPGSFVLFCILHFFSLINNAPFPEFLGNLPDGVMTNVFAVILSYSCGHFISGVFFHSVLFAWLFSYAPTKLKRDYPTLSSDAAWVAHRSSYQHASERMGPAVLAHIERHAALVHFTGHFSAGVLFAIIYIVAVAIHAASFPTVLYAVPLMVTFPGLYTHYRRLLFERYSLERAAIEFANNAQTVAS